MKNLSLQRRLASKLLKTGKSRVWIDPQSIEEVSKAITRQDIRILILRHVIQAKPKQGVSRGRARILKIQRQKGRRRGQGRRKGVATARNPAKRAWINRIRPLRRLLIALRSQYNLTSKEHREIYMKSKGNFFRSRAHLRAYVEKLKGK